MPNKTLVFVYNADSGFFNTVADIAHKITSPETYECELCALTHDTFTINRAWKQFVNHSQMSLRFYHRDEFSKAYPEESEPLPAIFIETDSGLRPFIRKAKLEGLKDVQQLIELVEAGLGDGDD